MLGAVVQEGWVWRAAPGWPPPPPGWSPPAGWSAPPEWPAVPPDWQFWYWGVDAAGFSADGPPPLDPFPEPERRGMVLETWFVQLVFLLGGITSAIVTLAALRAGQPVTRFPTIVRGEPLENLLLGIVRYISVAAPVPLALLLLSRTGQPPRLLGLGRPRFRADWLPGAGLALAGFGCAFAMGIAIAPFLASTHLLERIPVGDVPRYYVVYAVAVSAITAVTEETLVSGYLLTRLEQLGWNPQRALVLSLVLRTSYHLYYGIGLLFTIPLGYLLTRSFQKHRRLNRPIVAHFLYDAVLLSISILWL